MLQAELNRCILLNIFLIVSSTEVLFKGFNGDTFSHQQYLDKNGEFLLLWEFDDKNITFEVQAKSKGWVGLGFSPKGGMKNADIVMFYFDKRGRPILKDMYSTKSDLPVEDDKQDVTLVYSTKNDTHICFIYTRKQIACDPNDLSIQVGISNVIFAVSNAMPENQLQIHEWRGTKVVRIFNEQRELPPLPEDYKIFDIKVKNISIPNGLDTYYWCELIELPKWEQHYIVRFQYKVEEGNEHLVHHTMLYGCSSDLIRNLQSEVCYSKDLSDVSLLIPSCRRLIGGYGGGEPQIESFPNNAGMPLFIPGETHLVIQTHYNNPGLIKDKRDSSGFRFYLTATKPQFTTFIFGFIVPYGPENLVIPAHQKEFTHYMYCSSKCTDYLPEEGIKVFGGSFHGHSAAKKFRIQHIRNGKQLDDILVDDYFDITNANLLTNPTNANYSVVFPSDAFIFECTYDTTNRNKTTVGGVKATDEMCMAFLIGISQNESLTPYQCSSFLSPENLSVFNLTYKKEYNAFDINGTFITAKDFALNYLEFPNQTDVDIYQNLVKYGMHVIRCPIVDNGQFDVDGYVEQDGPPAITSSIRHKGTMCYN